MGHDIDPCTPRIGHDRENEFAGIKHRSGRVSQQRHPRVLLTLPQRPAPAVPLLLHPLIERVIILGGISVAELAIVEQRRRVTAEEQSRETRKNEHERGVTTHQTNDLSRWIYFRTLVKPRLGTIWKRSNLQAIRGPF